jgi:tetratricopeptide (TPR) repeat protein
LVTVAALLLLGWSSQAASPPNLYEALVAQQEQADLHPNDPEILNDLGNLLVLAGSLSEAEEAYHRSLELSPDNTTTRYNLGLVLMEQGRTKSATKELQYVLELDPNHAWALYQLGTISASAGRRDKAVDYYARALALNPDLASPAFNPHIIENRYLTESQLRLYLAQAEAAQAPRLYQRPNQVAQLLIPTAASSSTADTGTAQVNEGQTPSWSEEQGGQADPAVGDSETAQPLELQQSPYWEPAEETGDDREQAMENEPRESPRVITEEDLVPTSVGQGVGYVDSTRQPTSQPSIPRSGGTVTYPRTAPRSGTPQGQPRTQPQTVSPSPQPTPRSQSFVPAIGSTGRLDLELLFEDSRNAVAPGP